MIEVLKKVDCTLSSPLQTKLYNLKQMSKALLYLQENGILYYDDLEKKTNEAKGLFNDSSKEIKRLEVKMGENSALQKHIVNYSKTRDVYTAYRKAGYSKKFRAEHEGDILLHQAAKKAFDGLEGKKIPSVSALRKDYNFLLGQKKKTYAIYSQAKADMRELLSAKANIDAILNISDVEKTKGKPEGRKMIWDRISLKKRPQDAQPRTKVRVHFARWRTKSRGFGGGHQQAVSLYFHTRK